MKNLDLLLNIDELKVTSIKKNYVSIKVKTKDEKNNKIFNGNSFNTIAKKIKYLSNLYKDDPDLLIEIKLSKITFRDKATYILLETLLYWLCKNVKFEIKISLKKEKISSIYSADINNSILFKYKNVNIKKDEFIKDFEKMNINKTTFRKIISFDKVSKDKSLLSILCTDLDNFLSCYRSEEPIHEEMSEVLTELVGNAVEHSQADCLLDLNVAKVYKNYETYWSFDVVILNFSNVLLGDGIKQKIKTDDFNKSLETRKKLLNALENHKKKFNDRYTFEDFCNISTFQYRFSSRKSSNDHSGGTGLTTLIKTLVDQSVTENCYVYSGNKVIYLKKGYLELQENKYIGFNKSKDYFNNIPDKKTLARSAFDLNGTLYDLNFITKFKGAK